MDVSPLKIDRAPASGRRAGRRSRWTVPIVLLVLLALVFLVFQRQILEFVDKMRLPEVATLQITKRTAAAAATVSGTSANGYVVARTRAALSADTPGRIVELNVQEGSVVKKGDVVARLFSDEYAAALRRAEADLGLARAGAERATAEVRVAEDELEHSRASERAAQADVASQTTVVDLAQIELTRAQSLLDNGVGNQERLDKALNGLASARAGLASAQARLDAMKQEIVTNTGRVEVARSQVKEAQARVAVAQATRDEAQATLEKTNVRAPFDGIVVLKDAEVGEVVSPNSQGGSTARGSVVTMVDFATLEVQAEVPETSLSAVVLGAPAQVFLDAKPERGYAGRVDRIWPTANRTKATVEVRIVLEERDAELRPEMGVRIVFTAEKAAKQAATEAASAIVIPVDSIVRIEGRPHVFVLEQDVVRLRPITHGEQKSGKVAVEKGLVENEILVLQPPQSLRDGQRVRRRS